MQSNMPSITVDKFLRVVEMQFNDGNLRPIFGLGKGGIGKTESIETLAKEKLNVGYIDIRLLLYNETDLKGIPYPNAEHTKTVWLQNNILPTEERDGKRGILVFDEITSCSRSVRTAAYQLLNERRLGEYKLPDGWLIVCLGNGEDDGGDFQGMEGNFANRCSVFNVVVNLESWKDWAIEHGINELVSAYVSFRPQDLHTYDPESETDLLFASPRSWTAVSRILNQHKYDVKDVLLNTIIEANVGQRVGQTFRSFCKFKDSTVDPMKILKGEKIANITQQEVLLITIESVVKLLGKKVVDEVNSTNSLKQQTLEYVANTLKWIFSLQKTEHKVMAFKDLIRYNDKIMRVILLSNELNRICPEILKFAQDNKVIFS